MSKNTLTPEQDLLTREFYSVVANDDSLFPQNPAAQRSLRGTLLTLLNYVVVDGKFVDPDSVKTRTYGSPLGLDCEWVTDTRRAMEALNESDSGSEDETDSSEPPTDTEVREAVLREDV